MISKPNTRYLIIHADDGGLCHSVNRAIITALEIGIVTSTSLMPPSPQVKDIAQNLIQNPQFDVGIHLTLTCEYPHYSWKSISKSRQIKSIVDSNGNLKSKKDFIKDATPEAVETEIRAQIESILNLGLRPSHLDTHQGTVFFNMKFLESYVRLALEYNMTPMLIKLNDYAKPLIEERNLKIDKTQIDNR